MPRSPLALEPSRVGAAETRRRLDAGFQFVRATPVSCWSQPLRGVGRPTAVVPVDRLVSGPDLVW